ncbi:hypothetical protein BH09MYX1_BH09MYX1_63930 [soil metagenome]
MRCELVPVAVVAPPDRHVTSGSIHPNGDLVLLACGFDAANVLWSRKTGAFVPPAHGVSRFDRPCEWASFSPDGSRFAMARVEAPGHDLVLVVDTETQAPVHTLSYEEGTDGPVSLHWHPNGNVLVSTHMHDDGNAMRFWQVSGKEPSCLARRPSALWDFAFSPDGKWLVEDVYPRGLRRVDPETWEETMLSDGEGVYSRFLPAVGATILAMRSDGVTEEWNLETGALVRVMEAYGAHGGLRAVSPDGTLGVCTSKSRCLLFYLRTEALVAETPTVPRGEDVRVAFSPDQRLLLTYGHDTRLYEVRR